MATSGRQKTLLVTALTGALAISATPFAANFAFAQEAPQIVAQASTVTVSTGSELSAALASGAGTIQFAANITDLSAVTINQNVTLSLQGHQLTLASADGITCVSGAILISGGTIVNTSGSAVTNTGAALTLEGVTAGTYSNSAYAVKTTGTGATTITSGTYTATSSPILGTSANTTVTGGLFSSHIDDGFIPTSHYQLETGSGRQTIVFGTNGSVSGWSDVNVTASNAVYTGSPVTDNVTVKVGNTTLRNGTDYTLGYYNNVDAGTGVVVVTGRGSYEGKFAVATFTIEARPVVIWVDDYHRQGNQADPTFWVQISGLAVGHQSNISAFSAHCYHNTSNRGGIYEIEIVEPYEGLVIRDASGNIVTYNYDIYERSGRLVVDVDYLDLSNAEVKLVADPVPYKGSEYKDKDNISSVIVDGIDVTDQCNFEYSNAKDLGTATVTITAKGSSGQSYRSSRTYDSVRRSYNSLLDLVASGEPDEVIEQEVVALSAQAAPSSSYLSPVMGNASYRPSDVRNDQEWLRFLVESRGRDYIAPIRSVSGYYTDYANDGVTLSNGKVLGGGISKTFTITRRPVTVTGATLTKATGSEDPKLTATVTGALNGDESTIAYTVSRSEGEEAGTYAITPAGEIEQGNYAVTYVPGTLTITNSTPATGGTGAPTTPISTPDTAAATTSPATPSVAIPASTLTSRLATANTADASLAGAVPAALTGAGALLASLAARRRRK